MLWLLWHTQHHTVSVSGLDTVLVARPPLLCSQHAYRTCNIKQILSVQNMLLGGYHRHGGTQPPSGQVNQSGWHCPVFVGSQTSMHGGASVVGGAVVEFVAGSSGIVGLTVTGSSGLLVVSPPIFRFTLMLIL